MATADRLASIVARLSCLSLDDLDARAALQRRVDEKYLVSWERFERLVRTLGFDALEVSGRRAFHYDSVYFDTPDLRCFRDHVDDRTPRVKVRSRLYVDARQCVFELKLKGEDGDTIKAARERDPGEHGRLTDADRAFVEEHLARIAGAPRLDPLEPALSTRFVRATLVSPRSAERVTCDVDLRLVRPAGECVRLSPERVLLEAKTEDGGGEVDRRLREGGCEPVSMSKYRTGIALLAAPDPDPPLGDARRWFTRA